jgi:NADPH-dependent ferric siderophore reductase
MSSSSLPKPAAPAGAAGPAAAGRAPRRALLTEVLETSWLTPRMIRVVLGGDDLAGFTAGEFSDHYVKLQLPAPGASYSAPFDVEQVRAELPRELWSRTRTYSVRAWDRERQRLTIDFVYHGDHGVAGPWAAAAKPGDRLQLVGPGGAYVPDPEADWHLMIGDASVVPAISASLARIPARVPVHVLIEVDGHEDELPLTTPGDLHVQWLHHPHTDRDEISPLIGALERLPFPAGAVHAFVHGEASTVRAIRRHLLVDRGLPPAALSVSGYWKRSRTEEGWREDKPEWNRQVEQDTRAAGSA